MRNNLTKMLYKRGLLDDPDITSEYMEIIDDYMIRAKDVISVLNKASEIKKEKPGFDHYSYIVYGLIGSGKNENNN